MTSETGPDTRNWVLWDGGLWYPPGRYSVGGGSLEDRVPWCLQKNPRSVSFWSKGSGSLESLPGTLLGDRRFPRLMKLVLCG